MATKEFILQGFTARTHGPIVRDLFKIDDIQHVIISVAFVNESGVEQIEAEIKAHASKITLFAGIRNDITSFQGLARLQKIIGKRLHTVDTGSRLRIFHPKLFLVRGKNRAGLLIGSANLTLGGMNNNAEASLSLGLELTNVQDKAIVTDVEEKFKAAIVDFPKHVTSITSLATLEDMLKADRLIDEDAAPPPRPRSSKGLKSGKDDIGLIEFKAKPIRGKTKRAKPVTKKTITTASAAPATPLHLGGLEKVWESKPLTVRSLSIQTGTKTNPTGSTTLGKGLMDDIDPTTYFRDVVFGHLAWEDYENRAGNKAQKADGEFEIILKGTPIGRFTLTLRHSLTRVAAASEDKNLPTNLSWNEARSHISRRDLIRRTMTLHRDVSNPLLFAISID